MTENQWAQSMDKGMLLPTFGKSFMTNFTWSFKFMGRKLMNYVKISHGGVFRRVALSGMLDSTHKIVKTQGKLEQGMMRYSIW